MGMGADLVLWYLAFLASTVVHEASHALVAYRLGDPTAYQGGQVSLDPRPHIRREPVGTVVVPILSLLLGGMMFGWASAPYDPAWASRHPRRAAAMALAGPLANVALALVAAGLIRTGAAFGVLGAPTQISGTSLAIGPDGAWSLVAAVLSVLLTLNLTLATLNLLPVPPLDGGAALPLFLPAGLGHAWRRLASSPAFAVLGLLAVFQLAGPLIREVFLAGANLLWRGAASYG